MKKAITMVAITALMLLIVGLPTAIASDVSRTIPSGEQAPNTDIDITLTVTLDSGETYYSIDETIPAGLTIMDPGTGDISETGHIKWVVIQGATSTTFTYTVQGTDGTYNINGIYQIEGMTTPDAIQGNSILHIGQSSGDSDVSRTIPAGIQPENTDIPITISVTINGATYYSIDETIPAGLTITDPGTGDISETGHIKWVVIQGATSTSYTYKVQGTVDSYTFSGIYQIEGMTTPETINGNTVLTIYDGGAGNVCRAIPSGDQIPGVDIPISLEVTVDGATYYAIDEAIPEGLTITDPGTGDTSDPGHIKWVVTTGAIDTVYTYKVQGPIGAYTFSNGIFQIEGMTVPSTIDCNTNLVIDDTCPCDFCLELQPGYNYVSIPKTIIESESNAASDVFKLTGNEVCFYYDVTTEWNNYYIDWNPSIVPCRGYIVWKDSANTDYSVCVNFSEMQGPSDMPTLQLYNGWNLIGHVEISQMPVEDFASITGLDDTITQLWYRSNSGTWTGYPMWGLTSMTPGYGYWAFLDDDDIMAGTPYI